VTHLHIGVHTTNFVSTLRVFHSFNKKHVGGKKEKKKIRAFATPRLEVSPFTLSQTHRSAKRGIAELGSD